MTAPSKTVRAADIPVLYEDEWLLAVDKPAGIIVHPDGAGTPNLLDILKQARGARASSLQPVQRLDRDTTGIVLICKDKALQPDLDRMVAERRISKRYLAAVRGLFPQGVTRIDEPIGRDRHDSRRMRVSRTGKPSSTRVALAAHEGARPGAPDRSLLLVDLLTGRRHQIRVHLAHLGFPILGDALYGSGRQNGPLMLHAFRESFDHPVTGAPVLIRTAVPARFSRLFPGWG